MILLNLLSVFTLCCPSNTCERVQYSVLHVHFVRKNSTFITKIVKRVLFLFFDIKHFTVHNAVYVDTSYDVRVCTAIFTGCFASVRNDYTHTNCIHHHSTASSHTAISVISTRYYYCIIIIMISPPPPRLWHSVVVPL